MVIKNSTFNRFLVFQMKHFFWHSINKFLIRSFFGLVSFSIPISVRRRQIITHFRKVSSYAISSSHWSLVSQSLFSENKLFISWSLFERWVLLEISNSNVFYVLLKWLFHPAFNSQTIAEQRAPGNDKKLLRTKVLLLKSPYTADQVIEPDWISSVEFS